MSIRTKYTCPNCCYTLSDFSKKGFEILHSGIGLPYLICPGCKLKISTRQLPFSKMNYFKKVLEVSKTTLNILVISSIFGSLLIGGPLIFLLEDIELPLFDTSTQEGRVIKMLSFLFFGTLILGIFKTLPYFKWHRYVEQKSSLGTEEISLKEFKDRYPDW